MEDNSHCLNFSGVVTHLVSVTLMDLGKIPNIVERILFFYFLFSLKNFLRMRTFYLFRRELKLGTEVGSHVLQSLEKDSKNSLIAIFFNI